MKKATILVDMDSIIADFCGGLVATYNAQTGSNLGIGYIKTWDQTMPDGRTMYDFFGKPGFFRGLKPIPGAQEVLWGLHDDGHEICIVSTATLTHAPGEKYEWLAEHYPWLHRNRVFFCKEKYRVRGDFLIDDHHVNAQEYRTHNPNAITIGIAYEYNKPHRDSFDYLMHSYASFRTCWEDIGGLIRCEMTFRAS